MTDDTQYDEYKNKITEHLTSVGGKGADTIINIGKQIERHSTHHRLVQ